MEQNKNFFVNIKKPDNLTIEELIQKRAENKNNEIDLEKKAKEVCSRYKKGDIFDFSLNRKGNLFEIILDEVKVGSFNISINDEESTHIGMIYINENLQNKGFGKQLYIKLNDYLKNSENKVLMTDKMRNSPAATHLWESLEKDGLVEKLPDKTSPDGHPVYKFKKEGI